MRAIMLMFDSLNRKMLSSYGCNTSITPNFSRLAQKCVTFDTNYAGSLPCIPARRELHTGRLNFLHRSWGPLEPFDDSMPNILSENGIYTHLVTDHKHYFEDGGVGYHTRFNTWEYVRGQQGDFWKGVVENFIIPENVMERTDKIYRQDVVNRKYIKNQEEYPQFKTVSKGLEFIETNKNQDNWFVMIETFDPHEPFFAPEKYTKLFEDNYEGKDFDWPSYRQVVETQEEVKHCRNQYQALLTMCDDSVGRVLDYMDENNMWHDTMLIVNTDHGFLLSEHDWWGKMVQPMYEEIVHTPLFIWDPRYKICGQRRKSLTQNIDLAATILEFFDCKIPESMQGKVLKSVINEDKAIREYAIFGIHGGQINITNGKYVYMRSGKTDTNKPLYNYTLMPTHMHNFFAKDEIQSMSIHPPFKFTKECPVLQMDATIGNPRLSQKVNEDLLFDLEQDSEQYNPIINTIVQNDLVKNMKKLMRENDTPYEQFERMGM